MTRLFKIYIIMENILQDELKRSIRLRNVKPNSRLAFYLFISTIIH